MIFADRIKESSTTTGTGAITLAGAETGFRSFASVLSVADTVYYCIQGQTPGEWETGVGTYSGVNTLTRTTPLAGSAATPVSFSAGTKDVFITVGAQLFTALPVNVKSYGATGNGTTDDTTAIQTAISASGGRALYFPPGVYIAGSLNLVSNITLFGDGVGSVLKLKAATTYSSLVLDTVDSVTITNLKIDGNMANQSVVKYGIVTIAATKIIIDKVWITGTYGHGIYIVGASSKVSVTNSKFWSIGTDATSRAVFALDSTYVTVENNNIESILGFGLTLQNTPYSVLSGNTIGSITNYDGIIVYNCTSVVVSGNSINTTGDSGIVLELSTYCTVTGNNIKGVTYVGIYLAGSSYNNITGNLIKDASQATHNTYSDIKIQISGATNSTYNTITGNSLYATAANKSKYGIEEADVNQNYNVVNFNSTSGQVTAAILLLGNKSTSVETKDGQLFYRAPTVASYTRVATFYNPSATGIPFITVGKQEAEAADAACLLGYDTANNLGWLGIAGDSLGTGIHFRKGGKTGINNAAPTAYLHLPASTTAADTASLKITPGTVATTPVSGNIESDGTHLYWTDSSGTRKQLDN